MGNNVCSECNKNDQVLKVSSVYENGVRFTRTSGPMVGVGRNKDGKIGVGIGGSSQNGLSVSGLSLKLSPPDKPKKSGCLLAIGYYLLASGVIMSIYLMLNKGEFRVFFAMLIILASGIIILMLTNKKFNKQMEVYSPFLDEWRNLYYCQRDDIVFDNQTGFKINSSGLQDYFKKSINKN